jgi:hypothetical protein
MGLGRTETDLHVWAPTIVRFTKKNVFEGCNVSACLLVQTLNHARKGGVEQYGKTLRFLMVSAVPLTVGLRYCSRLRPPHPHVCPSQPAFLDDFPTVTFNIKKIGQFCIFLLNTSPPTLSRYVTWTAGGWVGATILAVVPLGVAVHPPGHTTHYPPPLFRTPLHACPLVTV